MDQNKRVALLTAIDLGNLTRAAEQLGYTQSGLSYVIKALEAELGFPLLVRSRAGVRPTDECQRILPLLRELDRKSRQLEQEAADIRGLAVGNVFIATFPYISRFWLPQILRDFAQLYPGITVSIREEAEGLLLCVEDTGPGIDPAVLHTPLWQPERMVQEVRRAIGEGTELFILNHVSNVFGAVCPLDEIGRLLSAAGVPLILDASQSAGVLELDVSRCPCLAAVCMPGHKALYGPMGTGLLLALDDRLASRPLMAGGTGSLSESMNQPDFLPDAQESGTPNVPGIAGLAAGIRFVRSVGAANIAAHERKLVRELARALEANERLEVFSHPSQTGVLSVRVKGVPAEQAAAQLADAGIAVRAGLHCAPLAHRTAGTEETGTVRLSFSFYSTPGQAEQAAEAFKLVKKL